MMTGRPYRFNGRPVRFRARTHRQESWSREARRCLGWRWWLRWMWFKHQRRRAEYALFLDAMRGDPHPWSEIKDDNEALGIWRRW